MLEEPLNISEYYEGVSVLITGASGFLGKVLLEKLVFSQPKLNKIYLLLRPLNGEAPHLRLSRILESPLFSRIRCKDENRLERMLVPICGDLMQEDLGLSCEDQETLANEVFIGMSL
uniref:Fatty acyl-CoA reductase n=1 Tax=Meloidogyne javanica TaxID=6303 RepID=A0A915LIV5_MELJA